MADEARLADDAYSVTLTRLLDNPAVVKTNGSTINLTTFLRNTETWFVQIVRADGTDHGFLQRVGSDGGQRWVLPPEVMAAIHRQGAALDRIVRRRGARKAIATKLAKGQTIGNVEALERARGIPRRPRRKRADVSTRKFGKAHP